MYIILAQRPSSDGVDIFVAVRDTCGPFNVNMKPISMSMNVLQCIAVFAVIRRAQGFEPYKGG